MEGESITSIEYKNRWVPELFVSSGTYCITLLMYPLLRSLSPFDTTLGNAALLVSLLFVIPGAILVLWRNWEMWYVSFLAGFLGCCTSIGIQVATVGYDTRLFYLGCYIIALSFFHQSEYVTTALFNPHRLSLDSYILNHSREYHIAAVVSWTEYSLESWLAPSLKTYHWLALLGLVLVASGEFLRKAAMFTARSNFSHIVAFRKRSDHELVTHGVYSLSRHPAYMGWFYWSIGTQVLLCNPVCTVAYAAASWSFFNERIEEEEIALLNFFGRHYVEYQQRVGTGLPFISGHLPRRE
ncbi:protein-S-isoprenylcysteine O-methyltransferase-like [Sycon ciliatum]|uniref:protein-S-isoprenylcysteine O-methyltransferase-like n=1 Tax=Sycon ciliatum TaxID=27933 RepID=UPI0020ACC366|eukprot:scpid60042/ scgid17229/ Protein-S-isoprenylcysteine O-methyltransferase; Farnesyl cysteine carboxyl methyltransferase; Isoprenylcysteine carboxylmethyltransferase; Prenylated protein carboxyl methyltransferase; Prenylcysteine carboxyl methyltransferase